MSLVLAFAIVFAIGICFGLKYKVLVLAIAMVPMMVVAAVAVNTPPSVAWYTIGAAAAVGVALQLGYLAGTLVRGLYARRSSGRLGFSP